MLIDAFLLLSEAGFHVRHYRYIGMGSVHFIDFALFHKYLGIQSMLSVELATDIDNRIKFNCPYQGSIEYRTGVAVEEILRQTFARRDNAQYFIWLDYDNILCRESVLSIYQTAGALSEGSILLVTVDTEPPVNDPTGEKNRKADNEENLNISKGYFEKHAREFLGERDLKDFRYELLPRINIDILGNAMSLGAKRSGKSFFPLFNFLYADGHRMLTIGGIVVDRKHERMLLKSALLGACYIRTSFAAEPFKIDVPVITRKEQMHLDSLMPIGNLDDRDFELAPEEVANYREIYRFYPTYAELLL